MVRLCKEEHHQLALSSSKACFQHALANRSRNNLSCISAAPSPVTLYESSIIITIIPEAPRALQPARTTPTTTSNQTITLCSRLESLMLLQQQKLWTQALPHVAHCTQWTVYRIISNHHVALALWPLKLTSIIYELSRIYRCLFRK